MRSHSHLFPTLVDADHLDRAAARTLRGKRRRPDVAWFFFTMDHRLATLRRQLLAGTWRPQRFEIITVRQPKPRAIARAPVEDRVLHNALSLILEPIFLRSASHADFACRPGFGTHRAVLRLSALVRRWPFCLHLDLRSYFPSIDLERLRGKVARRVRDRRFLAVLDHVLSGGRGLYDAPAVRRFARIDPDWPPPGRGLPIGTATSQLLAAHVYLQDFDHFVCRRLRVPGYVRYVDDMFLFAADRRQLVEWRRVIEAELWTELELRLKHPRAPVLSCRDHIDALGFQIRREGLEPLPAAWRRLRRRVGRVMRAPIGRLDGGVGAEDWAAGVASSVGHLLFG